jgi:uncharacterized membrane protein
MNAIFSFVVLSFLGLINAGYLVFRHYKKKSFICMSHDCTKVTESKWSKIFFIRNDILGVLFYLVMLMSIFLFIFYPSIKIYIFLVSGLAVLFSAFLVFIQMFKIKNYCFYCLISAIINIFIFVNSFLL